MPVENTSAFGSEYSSELKTYQNIKKGVGTTAWHPGLDALSFWMIQMVSSCVVSEYLSYVPILFGFIRFIERMDALFDV